VQKGLHPSQDALHEEIIDLKNKQAEIKTQQPNFKQEIEEHINSYGRRWFEGRMLPHPLQWLKRWYKLRSLKNEPGGKGS
jgi:hypothetical protein